jgi:hypothetical protein
LGQGNREQGTGNREQGTGNREQGTGNREQGTGNREQGTGNREQGAPPMLWGETGKLVPSPKHRGGLGWGNLRNNDDSITCVYTVAPKRRGKRNNIVPLVVIK